MVIFRRRRVHLSFFVSFPTFAGWEQRMNAKQLSAPLPPILCCLCQSSAWAGRWNGKSPCFQCIVIAAIGSPVTCDFILSYFAGALAPLGVRHLPLCVALLAGSVPHRWVKYQLSLALPLLASLSLLDVQSIRIRKRRFVAADSFSPSQLCSSHSELLLGFSTSWLFQWCYI